MTQNELKKINEYKENGYSLNEIGLIFTEMYLNLKINNKHYQEVLDYLEINDNEDYSFLGEFERNELINFMVTGGIC